MRCNEYKNRIEPEWNHGRGHEEELKRLISDIKESGKNNKYDCVIGLSGGVDSSYMLHLAVKEWGLRTLAIHIDCGWNLEVAENNIKRITDKLGIDLYVEKMDLDEMREMQLAWFRTGLEMLDAPQDHAFISIIDKKAKEYNVKYILNGYNICTEIVADPTSWEKGSGPTGDETFIKDVVKKYCKIPIKKYAYTSGIEHKFINPYIRGIKTVKPLNLVEFTKSSMIETLQKEYGYETYGQKHFEDLLTKFLEGYWQPTRFGQMTRDEALKVLENPPLSEKESKELFSEVAKRLEISEEELKKFQELPKSKEKFKSQKWFYDLGIRLYEKLGLEKRIRK